MSVDLGDAQRLLYVARVSVGSERQFHFSSCAKSLKWLWQVEVYLLAFAGTGVDGIVDAVDRCRAKVFQGDGHVHRFAMNGLVCAEVHRHDGVLKESSADEDLKYQALAAYPVVLPVGELVGSDEESIL